MSDAEYRTAIGFIYAGPFPRKAGEKTVNTYKLGGVGLNGDVDLKLDFWDKVPPYVVAGNAVLVSGKYSTWKSDDGEKSAKTIAVNKIIDLGSTTPLRDSGARETAPRKKPSAPAAEPE